MASQVSYSNSTMPYFHPAPCRSWIHSLCDQRHIMITLGYTQKGASTWQEFHIRTTYWLMKGPDHNNLNTITWQRSLKSWRCVLHVLDNSLIQHTRFKWMTHHRPWQANHLNQVCWSRDMSKTCRESSAYCNCMPLMILQDSYKLNDLPAKCRHNFDKVK